MSGTLKEIVFDCKRAATLARFWAQVLTGYAVPMTTRRSPVSPSSATRPKPIQSCWSTDRARRSASRKSSAAARRAASISMSRCRTDQRLIGLGASVDREADGYTVMADPEGNLFCVVEPR